MWRRNPLLGYGLRAITACFLPMLIAGTYGNIGQFKIVMRVVEEISDDDLHAWLICFTRWRARAATEVNQRCDHCISHPDRCCTFLQDAVLRWSKIFWGTLMKLGVFLQAQWDLRDPETELEEGIAGLVRQAELAYGIGYESVWLPQHYVSAPFASIQPGPLMGLLAGQTKRVRLGTGVYLLPFTHPVVLA